MVEIVSKELPEFFVEFKRCQITDVDIPDKVAQLAEDNVVQLGRNELAEKREAEEEALAKAKVAKAKGNYDAAQYDVKTKELLSRPAVLELYRAETERIWAEKGTSRYGTNNVFGSQTAVVRGLKGN